MASAEYEPRGARHRARRSRRNLVFGWIRVGIRTMKQPFASAARLRGGGPILTTGIGPCSGSGHRHLGSSSAAASSESPAGARNCVLSSLLGRSGCRPQHDALRDLAGGDHAPECDEQLAGEGDDHRRLARALRTLGPARYHCASALSFWNIRKRQASWIRPRRTRALPDLASPFSRRLDPLSSGEPVSPA